MSVELISTSTQSHPSGIYPSLKRGLDILLSLVALLILSPVFVFIALAIYLHDRGPIFYAQPRVGHLGKSFAFYKFRSMVINADALKDKLSDKNEASGPIFKMKNDPRITPVGRWLRKTSLDEIPQFWNVLQGDLSLVGPRPHLKSEIENFSDYPQARFMVMPGLICFREIRGRSGLTFEQWLDSDMEYVRHRSFGLDLWILLQAIPAILLGRGAY